MQITNIIKEQNMANLRKSNIYVPSKNKMLCSDYFLGCECCVVLVSATQDSFTLFTTVCSTVVAFK